MRPDRRRLLPALGLGLGLGVLCASAAAQTPGTTPPTPPTPPMPLPAEVAAELPDARLRGSATLRFLGLHIYDARLWSPAAVGPQPENQPLALELQYARGLEGQRIADRSIDEMRRIGSFTDAQAARWRDAMARLFPDVQAQDRITGVLRPGQGARFFFNGKLRGEVAEPEFARLFFGIWLSPRTSEPRLRLQLLGTAP